ncbi:MAG TPA: hypothetical protein VKD65_05035, partial [Candidatus Angelobacter sp.]|nr:hypothetical protein [Candidatus Angelobacter sp.]
MEEIGSSGFLQLQITNYKWQITNVFLKPVAARTPEKEILMSEVLATTIDEDTLRECLERLIPATLDRSSAIIN